MLGDLCHLSKKKMNNKKNKRDFFTFFFIMGAFVDFYTGVDMRLIHLKDIATLGNVAIGFGSAVLAIESLIAPDKAMSEYFLHQACYLIMAAYVFDFVDGIVARLTKMSNRFGAELDTIADHVTYAVCPAFIVFSFYHEISPLLAFCMGMIPLAFGCIRHARNGVYDISFRRFWLGTPRPVSAFYIVGVIGTQLQNFIPNYKLWVIPVFLWIGWNNLSFYPFLSHHGRKFNKALLFFMSVAVILLFSSGVATAVTGKPWLLDCLLFEMLVYTFLTPLCFDKDDMDGYKEYVAAKKAEIEEDMKPKL